jgi:hypothetical protein
MLINFLVPSPPNLPNNSKSNTLYLVFIVLRVYPFVEHRKEEAQSASLTRRKLVKTSWSFLFCAKVVGCWMVLQQQQKLN